MIDQSTFDTGVGLSRNGIKKVFTIGHSTLALQPFLSLLSKAGITAVADVRSSPFSRRSQHFNRDEFRVALREIQLRYVFLGNELGGRPLSSNLYCDGVADYEKMAREPGFLKGIDRIVEGSTEHTIALMCSEQNPLDCHRCLLVGRVLTERNMPLEHILPNGNIVTQHEIEEKLLSMAGSENSNLMMDMFASRDDLLATAYKLRARMVAFREPLREVSENGKRQWSNYAQ